MYRRVMAFDFDGTLAVNGTVPLGSLANLFADIVWENGAVLTHAASGETYLPFGQLDVRLLKAIKEAGIPFERKPAVRLRKVANRRYQGDELREALKQVVSTHYEEIRQMR